LGADQPGMLAVALVAFGAGLIRGFTGFGGPAFILAILTLFFTPVSVVSKIVVVDFLANAYLFKACLKEINWRTTATMVVPTILAMPLGHWLLLELDPAMMKRAMALIIAGACVLMLVGFRYRHPMTTGWLILVGVSSGIVFGGSYIALVAVVFILLGPYDKNAGRTLIVAWSFFTVLGFALIAAVSGTTGIDDVITAAPGAATYLLGSWLGSHGFRNSSEKLFRRVAISTLLALSIFNILS
jgi:uncharacterized membrane protein YfcA